MMFEIQSCELVLPYTLKSLLMPVASHIWKILPCYRPMILSDFNFNRTQCSR